jgi:hypothetical protein
VFNAIESNDHGYGDYYITLDLSQYFSVKEYDTESKKFKEDDVTDIIKNYAVLKFHYDENGARNSSQSLFGSIACNPSYDTSAEKVDTTYWQERMVYDLDDTSKLNGSELFTYRYSEVYDGYFLSLSMDGKKLFADMPRAKVNVTIDLTEILSGKQYKVVGLDYDAFNGVELDTLTIKGKTQKFYFLENALKDTQLQKLKHSRQVTLDGLETAIDSEYAEVRL